MLFNIFQIFTIIIVTVALSTSLAHALEMPGKMRLTEEVYRSVQPIYYPGFTVAGGIGETGGIILVTVQLILAWKEGAVFWLTLAALIGLVAMQAVYWIFTHPVNKFWLKDQHINKFSSGFFSFMSAEKGKEWTWQELRNRWEYSHVVRAVLALLSLLFLVIAISLDNYS